MGDDYIVIASKGHIADLAKGGAHGLGVNLETFAPKYVLSPDKVDLLDEILSLAKDCKLILLASDNDREGEAISWHLQERIKDVGVPMKRIKFNAITKADIKKALSNTSDVDMNLVHSQEVRRILDRIVGFMASPFLMNHFKTTLSAGRVQSVLTELIIDREREIESFIPENYWNIHVNLTDGTDKFTAKYTQRITDKKTADTVKSTIQGNPTFIVTDVISKEERRPPPAPMITSKLQQIMSKDYGMSADATMKAAQALYEGGYCTYIRTDSTRTSPEALIEVRQWLKDNNYTVPTKENVYPNKDSAQDAHECIRPTELSLNPDQNYEIIDPDQKKTYGVIWRYYISSQMMPAVYDTLKVTLELDGDSSVKVRAFGKALTSKGFMEILGVDDDSKIDIPSLKVGDKLALSGAVKSEKKQTQSAPRFSEATLIKELVNRGIGRPSTYADLLSKITSRNYVTKDGNMYHATELGKTVTDVLRKFFTFMDYNYTSELEQKLDDIASGKVDHIEMLKDFYKAFKQEINRSYSEACGSQMCEKCNSPMVNRKSKAGEEFLACSAFPMCRNSKNINKPAA